MLGLLLLVLLSFLRHPVVVAVLAGIHVYWQAMFCKTSVTHDTPRNASAGLLQVILDMQPEVQMKCR